MSLSEVMTILIMFHSSGYRYFKSFYIENICVYHKRDFRLLSYNRFVELIKYATIPLFIFMKGLNKDKTGCYYIDSTPLKVCHIIKREEHQSI